MVALVVEELSVAVPVNVNTKKNYMQLYRGSLLGPAESDYTCASVLVCDGNIQISFLWYLTFAYICKILLNTLKQYSPLTTLNIDQKNHVLCVKYKIFGFCTVTSELSFKEVRRTNQEASHQRIRKGFK